MVKEPVKHWKIVDQGRRYVIGEENGKLEVYNDTVVHRASGSTVSYGCLRGKGINISHNHFSNAKGNGIFLRGRNDEFNLLGERGGYVRLMDKHATGQSCPVCGTTVEKIQYLGGACYVCPHCQS